jgi:hypothetical protein
MTAALANIVTASHAAHRILDRGAPPTTEVRALLNDIVAESWRAAQMIQGLRTRLRERDIRS